MIVEAKGLTKKYRGHEALHGLDLKVSEGAVFSLIGPNGAGKTTTIRLLLNIIQPDAGQARLLGQHSSELSAESFQHIGCVSENQLLPKRLTVEQYFHYLRALYRNWDRNLEHELRLKLDLPADRALGKLSHGMRMKTVLAAALSFRPKLLILDEPLSGLDSLTRDEVVEGLLGQAEETTILISSHELAEIESFTTHIAFLDRGRLAFQESIESLHSRFREVNVVLSEKRELTEAIPAHWHVPRISDHALRFVDSAFRDDESLYKDLTQHFGAVRFDTESMSLRDIAKTLMLESRKEAGP